MQSNAHHTWTAYLKSELAAVTPLLHSLGFALDPQQKHLGGERYLMQAVTTHSGKKLILTGTRNKDGMRVVIKATRDQGGARELRHERECRRVLHEIRFAYRAFHSPKEVLFIEKGGFTISIQAFLEQECSFLERPLKEQFNYALAAFKAQESAHATTHAHFRLVKRTFGTIDAKGYLELFARFGAPKESSAFLEKHAETIEQYCGFLTHTDFVPHNFRIKEGTMFLLDHSSLRFGNKYEGWARFLNFMSLYNPALEKALIEYVQENRAPEELLSLRLMRVYRLGEIVHYYRRTLEQSTGDLLLLNKARVEFWSAVLEYQLKDAPLPSSLREEYMRTRDSLRSEEEKARQIGLH